MTDSEASFTLVPSSDHHKLSDDWIAINGGIGFSPDTSIQAALRRQYPELALTVTTSGNGLVSNRYHRPAKANATVQWLSSNSLPLATLPPISISSTNPCSAIATSTLAALAAVYQTDSSKVEHSPSISTDGVRNTSSYILCRWATSRCSTY